VQNHGLGNKNEKLKMSYIIELFRLKFYLHKESNKYCLYHTKIVQVSVNKIRSCVFKKNNY
jgi:hypothetical protein